MNLLRNRNDIITYTVNKNINNNLYISVQNGEVVVKAPWYLSRNEIQEMVEEKKRWILEKLKEYEIAKEGYCNGEVVRLLGENYQVKIRYKNIKVPQLDLEEKEIKITIPNKYKKVEKEDLLKVLIEKMYQTVAQREVERAMEKMRKLLKIAPEDYSITKMNNRLASCSEDKKITINANIAMYSEKVIDYVILHQFCHLKYKKHVKGFYEMIRKYMPDYEKYASQINNLQY